MKRPTSVSIGRVVLPSRMQGREGAFEAALRAAPTGHVASARNGPAAESAARAGQSAADAIAAQSAKGRSDD
jgi:hypothetical protein